METKTAIQKYEVKCNDCSRSMTVKNIETAIKIAKEHATARSYMDAYHASSITFIVGA